jgi:acetyl-CoA C-acetyltransferase
VDLYSCVPPAVQIAARELGLALDQQARSLTVTGGLTFAGGPGNNYCSHAVATLVALLRADPQAYGLATAVGWYLTKHAIGIYSARPPRRPFASLHPQPRPAPARRARGDYAGPATVEACTVAYARDGAAEAAVVSALTRDGERVLIRSSDAQVIDALLASDPLGRPLQIAADQRLALQQHAAS